MNDPPSASPERPRVVVVAGPTGAGKTALGLRLARRFGVRAQELLMARRSS